MTGKEDVIEKIKDYTLGWNAILKPLEECRKENPEEVKMLENILKDAICWNWALTLAEDLKTQKGFEREANAVNNVICISECSTKDFLEYIGRVCKE